MNINWSIAIPIIILGLGLLSSILYYLWDKKKYLENRVLFQKIYYLLIILFSLTLYFLGEFPYSKNTELAVFMVGVILVDLMIFQTPEITKFLNSELKHEDLTQTLEKNEGTLHLLTDKIICVNDWMPKPTLAWRAEQFDFSLDAYEDSLIKNLEVYTNEFNINLYSYHVPADAEEDVFKQNITTAYDKIRKDHGFTIRGVGMRRKYVVENLSKGQNIEILQDGIPYVLFPYFGEYYNFLFVISGRNNVPVGGADTSLLLNMLYTFDYWLTSNEGDLTHDSSE